MITVIAGSNRKNSEAERFARHYFELFSQKREKVQLLNLADLPLDMFHTNMYDTEGQSKSLISIQDQYLINANKLFFVVSEYNGGMPGVLKLFIDACSVRNLAGSFHGKKGAMVGISSGRAGCIRGMEHLTAVLNYLQVTVMPNRLPISSIHQLLDEEGRISDKETLDVMEKHLDDFIKF